MIKIVNIIIPIWHSRKTLPQALDSLVAQTKKLFIVTLVQDGDEEDYTDIVEEYQRRNLKIRLIQSPENRGPGCARQLGMDSDRMCEYFMFLDSDDMLYPRAVEVLSREISLNNADIVISSFMAERTHTPGQILDSETTPVTWTHGKIYRAQYLRENNIRFLPNLRLNEDSYFNLVAANSTKNRIRIKEVTYLWRDNQNSLTRAECDNDFFVKSWEQYIESQVQGLLDIEKNMGEIAPTLMAATLNNMYVHMMRGLHLGLDMDEARAQCGRLTNNNAVMSCLNEPIFWQAIHEMVKASILLENELIFCKMRFCDWLSEYITHKEVEIDIE